MKSVLLVILFSGLLIASCKKKNPDPITPKVNYSMKHSGAVDSSTFSLETNIVSDQLIQMRQWDDNLFKVLEIQTCLKGPHLTENILQGQERLTLDFSFVLLYDISEYNTTCGCLPTPSATRLAAHINNSGYGWNDPSERKEVQIIAHNDQFGDGSYQIINPQITAEAIGSSLHIYGTIDSLKVGSFFNDRFLTNLHFDYTVPVNP